MVDYSLFVFVPNGFCLRLVSISFSFTPFCYCFEKLINCHFYCYWMSYCFFYYYVFCIIIAFDGFRSNSRTVGIWSFLFDYVSLFPLCLFYSRNVVFVLGVLVVILFLLFLSSLLFVRLTKYESNFIVVDFFGFCDLNGILSFIVCWLLNCSTLGLILLVFYFVECIVYD